MEIQGLQQFVSTTLTELVVKVLAAIAFWIVGRWLIWP
jgi:small conductance mechanosensitive channel